MGIQECDLIMTEVLHNILIELDPLNEIQVHFHERFQAICVFM